MAKGGSKSKPIKENKNRPQTAPAPSPEIPDSGNVDKIRDILFGNQMRDYDQKLTDMQAFIRSETEELRNDVKKRFESFENYFKEELNEIKERLKSEANARSEGEKRLSHEFTEAIATVSQKISNVEEHLSEKTTALREQLLEQSKKLYNDIQEKDDKTNTKMQQAVQALTDAKVDRTALSDIFVDLAMRLSNNKHYESLALSEE